MPDESAGDTAAVHPAIDSARLKTLLDGVNGFGRNPATGGFDRPAFSDADMAVREWFAAQMTDDGLHLRRDGAGNLCGRFGPADGPALLIGSHLDTVPDGGAFDGSLGVCIALECVRSLRDAGIAPARAIEVIATADEEGRFGGMLGSQAIAGQITQAWLQTAADADGVSLCDAMRAQGLDPALAPAAARAPDSISAFIELHIEQGPVLTDAGVSVGIVDAVSGVCHLNVRFDGVANHSGTTPMECRSDAFAGLAALAQSIPGIIEHRGTAQSRITIGKVDLQPNFPHTIPGTAAFCVILRDTDEAIMQTLLDALVASIEQVSERHGLQYELNRQSWLPPVRLDADLVARLQAHATRMDLPFMTLPSGAGHDAQTLQSLCPSALIFVPSRDGISHAPAEWTDWSDIEKGAALMLSLVHELVA